MNVPLTKLERIQNELIDTERTYKEAIYKVDSKLLRPILTSSKLGRNKNLKALCERLRERINPLINLSKELLIKLEAARMEPDRNTAIAQVLSNHASRIEKVFGDFAGDYNEFREGIEKLLNKEKIEKILELQKIIKGYKTILDAQGAQVEVGVAADIFDDLITPIQRLTKYPLLLGELLKNTEKEDAAFEVIKAALYKINSSVSGANDPTLRTREQKEMEVALEVAEEEKAERKKKSKKEERVQKVDNMEELPPILPAGKPLAYAHNLSNVTLPPAIKKFKNKWTSRKDELMKSIEELKKLINNEIEKIKEEASDKENKISRIEASLKGRKSDRLEELKKEKKHLNFILSQLNEFLGKDLPKLVEKIELVAGYNLEGYKDPLAKDTEIQRRLEVHEGELDAFKYHLSTIVAGILKKGEHRETLLNEREKESKNKLMELAYEKDKIEKSINGTIEKVKSMLKVTKRGSGIFVSEQETHLMNCIKELETLQNKVNRVSRDPSEKLKEFSEIKNILNDLNESLELKKAIKATIANATASIKKQLANAKDKKDKAFYRARLTGLDKFKKSIDLINPRAVGQLKLMLGKFELIDEMRESIFKGARKASTSNRAKSGKPDFPPPFPR